MKKIYFVILAFFMLSSYSQGQITETEATKIVNEYIESLKINNYSLYRFPEVIDLNSSIETFKESISPQNLNSYAFFIDKYPLANWTHPCSFLFIEQKSGKIKEVEYNLPPSNLDKWEILTEIKVQDTIGSNEQDETELYNYVFESITNNSPLLDGCDPDNCYAVIISGGADSTMNDLRYWKDCSAIYKVLKDLNYDDDNIYVLMSDGTDPGLDLHVGTNSWVSSDLDLDDDEFDDIDYPAKKDSIEAVFDILVQTLDTDDHLLIFVTDHGNQLSGTDVEMFLWDDETMSDDEFAYEVGQIDPGCEISIVMGQCNSGGFVDEFEESSNVVIMTACDYDEQSYYQTKYTYDNFLYHWIAAVGWENPDGGAVSADDNTDEVVSMEEAYNYATNPIRAYYDETPQISDFGNIAEKLTLEGLIYNPEITDESFLGCSGASFYVDSIPSGAIITWDHSSNIDTVIGFDHHDNPCQFKPVSTFYSASGWVEATISTSCDTVVITETFIVNPPPYDDTEFLVRDYYGYIVDPIDIDTWWLEPSTTYEIYLDYDNTTGCSLSNYDFNLPAGFTITYDMGWGVRFSTPSAEDYYYVTAEAETCCCDTSRILQTGYLEVFSSEYLMILSPNPSSGETTVTLVDKNGDFDENMEWDMETYDMGQTLKAKKEKIKGNKHTLNVSDWKTGVYIVRAKVGDKIVTGRLAVE